MISDLSTLCIMTQKIQLSYIHNKPKECEDSKTNKQTNEQTNKQTNKTTAQTQL